MNEKFWHGKRVLVTGHTGFKGGWLSLWLQKLGATVAGFALPIDSGESLFELAAVEKDIESIHGDIRDIEELKAIFKRFRPEIVFHLAAQALVRQSYVEPLETYEVNILGTAHVLEAARMSESCRAVINVTSDKCYENREWEWGYRECDPMGGHDPYSSSKGCAELVTAAYRRSFFNSKNKQRVGVASARAGNVIGGGDFSKDRIIPDLLAASSLKKPLYVRSPDAVRPWQHVLEPLSGYLLLAEKLWSNPTEYAQGWNFGPAPDDIKPVRWIVERLNSYLEEPVSWEMDPAPKPHEAHLLMLDSTKARLILGWRPRWTLDDALGAVAQWQVAYRKRQPLRDMTMRQIAQYEGTMNHEAIQRDHVAATSTQEARANGP